MLLIAAGSNQSSGWGNVAETILKAGLRIGKKIDVGVKRSFIYRSPAFPAGSGPDFVNAAFACDSLIPAPSALAILHEIEQEAGRTRAARWGQRTLDLDLIASHDAVMPDVKTWRHWADLPLERQMQDAPDQLILPHPRMQDRAFVLQPLADIAPDWVHPVLGLSIVEMLEDLPHEDRKALQRIDA